jgi:Xaa-Pro aminopeptidase
MSHPGPEKSLTEAPFASRRAAIFESLGEGVIVLPSSPISFRSRDSEYRYRPDSELFYATGVTESQALAVLIGGSEPRFELFVLPRDPEAELWAGPRLGPEAARERFGADACYPLSEMEGRLAGLLKTADRIYYRERAGDGVGDYVSGALRAARAHGPRTGAGPRALVDPGEMLDELRLRKDPYEVAQLRTAAAISEAGQRAGAACIAPGAKEFEIEAAVEMAFRAGGAAGPGFATIVGAGDNACTLHYVDNKATVGEGDLVLVDAGAEFGLYNGDITRTYPANGRFSEEQRVVYDIVNAARAAAIAAARPGGTFASVHAAAVNVIAEGLVDIGVLQGAVADLIEDGAHKPFFPHQTSHWLGLDVHDPGDYMGGGASRELEAGMVFTVEPGLYFRPSVSTGAAAHFAGIGVRIEDDVLMTEGGIEVLTAGLPNSADEVEQLVVGR